MASSEIAFQEFRNQLHKYVGKRVVSQDDVEDILQDVFVRVVRNEAAFQKAEKPLAWLYTVTHSQLVDYYRKKGTMPPHINDEDVLDALPAQSEELEHDFGECLMPLVNNLPEKYRHAVEFVDLGGGRQTEYARHSGLTLTAAKSRVQRGRHLLKNAIAGCCRIDVDGMDRVVALEPAECSGTECC